MGARSVDVRWCKGWREGPSWRVRGARMCEGVRVMCRVMWWWCPGPRRIIIVQYLPAVYRKKCLPPVTLCSVFSDTLLYYTDPLVVTKTTVYGNFFWTLNITVKNPSKTNVPLHLIWTPQTENYPLPPCGSHQLRPHQLICVIISNYLDQLLVLHVCLWISCGL